MVKKSFKYFILFFAFIFASFIITNTHVNAMEAWIYDDAGILSGSEEANLYDELYKIGNNEYIYIIITSRESYIGMEDEFFKEYVANKGFNADEEEIVGLTINMSSRRYDLFTYGKSYSKITDYEITKIENKVEKNLRKGDYYEAIVNFAKLSYKYYNPPIAAIIVPLVVAIIIAVIILIVIILKYKHHLNNNSYPLNQFSSINYTETRDIFLGSSVIKHRIDTDSDSGGSGSSSSSSHGSSGGGHRGGGSF
jgi:uncharacterized membrane protein YgcG